MKPTVAPLSAAASAAAAFWVLVVAWGAAVAGPPPPPAAPPVPREVLIDPNAPEAPVLQATAPGVPADPAMVGQGQHMYKDFCQKCHGVNMVSPGGGFFDLRTFPPNDKSRFVDSVMNGKRAMPPWGGVLKPGDIDLLWAYISSGGVQ